MITITVEDLNGERLKLEIEKNESLSLMEVLRSSGYDILAACGGIALCATCHVQIAEGMDKLPSPSEAELIMLDTLPDADLNSRLSCQIKVNENLDNAVIRIKNNA